MSMNGDIAISVRGLSKACGQRPQAAWPIHLLMEADDARALARAMQALTIRMAKGLNTLMDRHGRVFADRYHSRSLRTA